MRNKIIGFVILTIFIFSGCDKVELEDRGVALMIGIEKKEDLIKIYATFPDFENTQTVKKATGKTIEEAINNINEQIRQSIYFGHTRVCLIDEKILNDKKIMGDIIDFFEENAELSGRVIMLRTNESIESILSLDLNEMTGLYISGYYDYSDKTPKKDFIDMAKDFYDEKEIKIPFIYIKDESLIIDF